MGPVSHYLETSVNPFYTIRWNFKQINCFIESGIGVQVCSELHSHLFHHVYYPVAGKIFCAIEAHMLTKMSKPLLTRGFTN